MIKLKKGQTIHIFHHNDADGYASAFAIMHYGIPVEYFLNNDVKCYSCKHGISMNFDDVNFGDLIFIVDYSFSNPKDQEGLEYLYKAGCEIIWIDHHKTSKDLLDLKEEYIIEAANKGLVRPDNPCGACMLSYIWAKCSIEDDDIIESFRYANSESFIKLMKHYEFAPTVIQYISDFDSWNNVNDTNTAFMNGLRMYSLKDLFTDINRKENYSSFLHSNNKDILTNEILEKGYVITKYCNQQNKIMMNNSFERTIKFEVKEYSCLCCNIIGNSLSFGDRFYEYDLVMVFLYDGEQYNYTMFSKEDGCNVGDIAKFCGVKYGITGGGHLHAAGFSAKEFILDKEVVEI